MSDETLLTQMRAEMRDRFDGLDDRIDKMVTKGEFDAQVQRLDGRIDHTERTATEARATATAVSAEARAALETLEGQAKADHKQIVDDQRRALESFTTNIKWWVGIGLTITGLLLTFVSPWLRQMVEHSLMP